ALLEMDESPAKLFPEIAKILGTGTTTPPPSKLSLSNNRALKLWLDSELAYLTQLQRQEEAVQLVKSIANPFGIDKLVSNVVDDLTHQAGIKARPQGKLEAVQLLKSLSSRFWLDQMVKDFADTEQKPGYKEVNGWFGEIDPILQETLVR